MHWHRMHWYRMHWHRMHWYRMHWYRMHWYRMHWCRIRVHSGTGILVLLCWYGYYTGTGTQVRVHRYWYAIVRSSCSDAVMQSCNHAVVQSWSCIHAVVHSRSRAVVHSCSHIVVQSCSSSNGSSGDIGGSSIEGPEQFPSVPNCPYLIVPVLVPSVPELAIVLVFCYCIRFHTKPMGNP